MWIKLLLAIAILTLTGCFGSEKTVKKPVSTFTITGEADVPDRSLAVPMAKNQAFFLLSKAYKIDKTKFKYLNFDDNQKLLFSEEVDVSSVPPVDVKAQSGGYKVIYKIERSKKELENLEKREIYGAIGVGVTLEHAFTDAFKKVLKNYTKDSSEKVEGYLTIVNVNSINYSSKNVTLDLDLLIVVKDSSNLTKREKANILGDQAVSEYYKKKYQSASNFIKEGFKVDQNCDRCFYAKALLKKDEGDIQRVLYYLEQAIKIDPNVLKYYQLLQKVYYAIDKKMESYKIESEIMKRFDSNGDILVKENPPKGESPKVIKLPKMESLNYKNGITLTKVIKKDLPIVQITAGFKFGTALAPIDKIGVVKAMINMLKDGVEGMSSKEIAQYIDQNGLYLWETVSGDYSQINCASLKDKGDKCVEILTKLLKTPTFPKKEFKKYMNKEIRKYQLKESSPHYLASKLLYRVVYQKPHPYRYYDSTLKTISNISHKDIKTLYNQYLIPENIHFIVSGDIDNSLMDSLKNGFESWEKSGKKIENSENKVKKVDKRGVIYLIHRPGSVQATIKMGTTTIPYKDDNFLPLYLANQIFGGGASSRLFMQIREKEGLTYGVYSGLSEKKESGIFIISGDVKNSGVKQAINSMFNQLSLVKKSGFKKEELKNKVENISGKFSISLEKLSALNDEILKSKFYGIDIKKIENFLKDLKGVKVDQINKVFNSIIDQNRLKIVVVGDYTKILSQLKSFGDVLVIDSKFKPIKTK